LDFEFYWSPIYHIIIHNLFTKKQNQEILQEAIKLKANFGPSGVGGKGEYGPRTEFRNNLVCFYDMVFKENRQASKLLKYTDEKMQRDQAFREPIASSPYPLSEFLLTTTHETQVSRYGSEGQKYKWHIDRFADYTRTISMVYWFFKEPKTFKGGDVQLTDSPIFNGNLMDNNPLIKTIVPENNMAIIFGGSNAHRVLTTKSSKKFENGRFSMNCWVGFR